ncbi:MAG: CBS domain-containing protein [Sediminibacterium sp.]|nr:CBS domain-containing protein [Sediminibacterium sp.]
MKIVSDILKKKGHYFNVIHENESVFKAITLMKTDNLSYLIVLNSLNNFLGVISERDYVHKVELDGKTAQTTIVKEIMTKNLPVVEVHETITNCVKIIDSYKVRYLAAFDKQEFRGILTIHDFMRYHD